MLIALLTLLFGWKASRIGFSYDFEAFFPQNREVEAYEGFKDSFLTKIEPIWIGIELDGGLFGNGNLEKISALTRELRSDTLIRRIQSVTTLKIPISTGIGVIFEPYVHPGKSDLYSSDSIRLVNSPLIRRSFVSDDLGHTAILIQTDYELDKASTDSLGSRIKQAVASYDFPKTHVVGRLIDQSQIVDKLLGETILFLILSALVVCFALAYIYRTFWAVFVPLVVVSFSAVWLIGTMSFLGKDIDVLMTLAPTILFIVGVSDIIHFLTRYLEEFRRSGEKISSIRKAFREVGMATLITSLTTAIGFLSLLTSPIQPVRSFGVFISIGVMIAYFLAFTLLPAVLILTPDSIFGKSHRTVSSQKNLHLLFGWVLRNRRIILIAHGLVFIVSIAMVRSIRSDQFLTEELPKNHPLTEAFDYMETHFSGVRAIEVAIQCAEGRKLTDLDLVKQIDAIENYLRVEYGAGALISPATNWKLSNQIATGGEAEAFRIPGNALERSMALPIYRRIAASSERRLVLNSDDRVGRIGGQMQDIGGYAFLQKQSAFEAFCAANAPDLEVEMTGLPYLLNLNNAQISRSMLQGIALAFMIVSILMALLYRDVLMVLIALLPNILPLLLVGLVMVLLGIDLNVSTSLLFTVVFGIAVDDTIHVLSKLKIEMNKGKSRNYALKRAMISTGQALVMTSIILCAGFISLVFSEFNSSYLFGLLVSIGLVFALLTDLLLLPALLLYWKR